MHTIGLIYQPIQVIAMEKTNLPAQPTDRSLEFAKSIDEAFHAQLAKSSMGLSPIALSLAYADWVMHLAVSPGRQMSLTQRAMALSQQALTDSLKSEPAAGADGKPVREKDPRFSDASWSQWPFNALKHGFKASDAWWRESTQVDGVSKHHNHMVNFFTDRKSVV